MMRKIISVLLILLSVPQVAMAQYPTMIPVTDELLTAQPTTEPERSGRSDVVASEEEEDGAEWVVVSEEKMWVVVVRSICVSMLFVGGLIGMVVVLRRGAR